MQLYDSAVGYVVGTATIDASGCFVRFVPAAPLAVGRSHTMYFYGLRDTWEWCFLCYGYGYLPGYDSLSGTSMATPHVAGLAALVWARGQCTTNTCVRSKIESTADPIPGTGTYWKYGRVNYLSAVN